MVRGEGAESALEEESGLLGVARNPVRVSRNWSPRFRDRVCRT